MGALERASRCDLRAAVGVCAILWLSRVVVASIVVLGSPIAGPGAQLPRSVLILDQSGRDSVWFDAFFSGFRSTLNPKSAARVSVYSEHLDLSRFGGRDTMSCCADIFVTNSAKGRSVSSLPKDQGRSNSCFVRVGSCGPGCQ
jgi:hypothetical protein